MSRWNTREPAEMLGDAGEMGSGAVQRWSPRQISYYQRQWKQQCGAWGDPSEVADHIDEDVKAVITAFKDRGTKAGLEVARRRGLEVASRVYLDVRADTEEQLAARLARIRARLAREPDMNDRLREAFVKARLAEVRASGSNTPPQAVADQPEVPRKQVPRWVPMAALTLSVVALVRSLK